MRWLRSAVLALACALLAGSAAASLQDDLQYMDMDGDGCVTLEEFTDYAQAEIGADVVEEVIEEIFGDKSRVCTGARGGPAFWQSQARPITVPGEKWKGQPLPGCTQPECWLPSSPSAAGEPTTVTIFGMSYCGHSMRAATNLFSLVENRPDKYRGRVFWGDQGGMDAPVSLPKESLKDRLTQFCQSKGCGYSRQTHPTFPIVFIGDKFVGGNSDFEAIFFQERAEWY